MAFLTLSFFSAMVASSIVGFWGLRFTFLLELNLACAAKDGDRADGPWNTGR
jgi:hypothetical protein